MADSEHTITFEPVTVHRVVTTAAAIESTPWSPAATVIRTAPDETFVIGDRPEPPEPDAIVFSDAAWSLASVAPSSGAEIMSRHASWPPPPSGSAQGMVAAIAVKLVVEPERWIFLVPSAFAQDFADRVIERVGQ